MSPTLAEFPSVSLLLLPLVAHDLVCRLQAQRSWLLKESAALLSCAGVSERERAAFLSQDYPERDGEQEATALPMVLVLRGTAEAWATRSTRRKLFFREAEPFGGGQDRNPINKYMHKY